MNTTRPQRTPENAEMTTLHRLIAVALLAAPATAFASEPVAEPPVPAELFGTAYHTLTGRAAQVTFSSRAPLDKIVGKSNRVVGYLVAGPEDNPADLAGAHWVLPVASLATGIPLRDEHMIGREWLDAGSFPTIEFTLTSVEDIAPVKSGDGFSTWSATLVGEMTMHGQSRPLRVENTRLSFLDESPKTKNIADGDLAFVKCTYAVKMSDFGITHKEVPDKVADTIELKQMLRLSTVVPEPEATPQD